MVKLWYITVINSYFAVKKTMKCFINIQKSRLLCSQSSSGTDTTADFQSQIQVFKSIVKFRRISYNFIMAIQIFFIDELHRLIHGWQRILFFVNSEIARNFNGLMNYTFPIY